MDVPEIRAKVALHVCRLATNKHDRHHLALCARVCKDWHATFTPLLYRFFSLSTRHQSLKRKQQSFPSPEALQANSHFVQELYLALSPTQNTVLLLQIAAALQDVRKLEVNAFSHRRAVPTPSFRRTTDEDLWLPVRQLLDNNRGIQELHISSTTHPDCIAHIAVNCSLRLTTLRLSYMNIEWHQLLLVLTNCRRLRSLDFGSCSFKGSKGQLIEEAVTSQTVTTNITNLQLLESSGEGKVSLVDWLKMFPRLETLSVADDKTPWLGPVSQFNPGLQLSSLHLDCVLLKDAELAEVLVRCTSLKELILERASVTRLVFAALSGHFNSLICLNLTEPVNEQWMLKRIFEGCSRLEELYAIHVDVSSLYDIALVGQEDLPWACRSSLKTLSIMDVSLSLDESTNDRFMKQLMDLNQLQKLSINAIYRGYGSTQKLEPKDVPGDTFEARLLAILCQGRHWRTGINDLKQDPRWRLLKEAWPWLLYYD